ncbi:hypothetical protein GIB67_024465, partial [Kingdonia uniflora]
IFLGTCFIFFQKKKLGARFELFFKIKLGAQVLGARFEFLLKKQLGAQSLGACLKKEQAPNN